MLYGFDLGVKGVGGGFSGGISGRVGSFWWFLWMTDCGGGEFVGWVGVLLISSGFCGEFVDWALVLWIRSGGFCGCGDW